MQLVAQELMPEQIGVPATNEVAVNHVAKAQELFRGLKDRGKDTELVFYPREGHGISEYYHLQDRLSRIYGWVTSHVAGESAKPPTPRQ